VGRVVRRPPTGSQVEDCGTTVFTPRHFVRRRGPHCCRVRNHHSVGMGSITETATSAPGNSSLRPNTKAPLAMTLKLNGYSTAQFGKCHEVPVWQSSPMGPFDAWPSAGGGFETFYGFIGGRTISGIRRFMTVRRRWSRPRPLKRLPPDRRSG
jgi:hypothetical protein